ncbi:hypothetical protein OXPF_07630 [Oxobacter pfennigii]|uniref:Uncharacterized protein n=1 Tax=Oxobacter pfennigii TaxID=36849 RepID=A0A0P8WSF6_9CLOT|nr:hypothetical protein [Oxobacter pfennigii]KPU45530.1 hypothetical protein OXPF_07630 [Oxobacter pfennigii]
MPDKKNFSVDYTKMCEKNYLLKFNKMHKGRMELSEGDYFLRDGIVLLSKTRQLLGPSETTAWLPTMEELLDILGLANISELAKLIQKYLTNRKKCFEEIDEKDDKAMLLAIYMHLKFKKIWRGNQWLDVEL